jgi:hypothetical protein
MSNLAGVRLNVPLVLHGQAVDAHAAVDRRAAQEHAQRFVELEHGG